MTTAKVLAVGTGLLNGWLIQRTETRQGRMRPWHLIFGFIGKAQAALSSALVGFIIMNGKYWKWALW